MHGPGSSNLLIIVRALSPQISFPTDAHTSFLMLLRCLHLLAGFVWLGLLYFFNLVNLPFLAELDPGTRAKVVPLLMPRALWWFRVAAVVTVLAGLAYWGSIVASDAHNGQASSGTAMASFFLIWTAVWAILYAFLIPGKGVLNRGPVLAVLVAIVVAGASWLFLDLNDHGWESSRMLAIGLGGGLGWVMLLNVWGVIWRIQKRLIRWTAENAREGTAIPERSQAMARMAFLSSRINAFLSLPMLFCMAAASHYPIFGR